MTHKIAFFSIILTVMIQISACTAPESLERSISDNNADIEESLKDSLIYLDISAYSYAWLQPWKSPDITQRSGYATAVAPYRFITTAWNVADVAFIKARRYGKNEYISAKVSVVDYEANLCLLEVDPNTAGDPFKPVVFSNDYVQGSDISSFWLSSAAQMKTGRGFLDRADVIQSTVSYPMSLNFIVSESVKTAGKGRLYLYNNKPIGIACWVNTDNDETGLIPAESINSFLNDASDGEYNGFGTVGFSAVKLLDPTLRTYLNLPDSIKNGVLVNKVNEIGTGSDVLMENDVLLAINGKEISPDGYFEHKLYERLPFHQLITNQKVGENVQFEIWRKKSKTQIFANVNKVSTEQMLIPYHEFDKKPEYIVTGGYIFQQLTRNYMTVFGEDWQGKVPPYLYSFFSEKKFDPTEDQQEIVILSYVLPHRINLGYHNLRMLAVKSFNGIKIRKLTDILQAQNLYPGTEFDIIEFEQDNPTVVIPRANLLSADTQISQLYGIERLMNIDRKQ